MGDVTIAMAIIGALGAALGYFLKYLTENKTVSLTAQELLDKKRSDFHDEVIEALKREQESHELERKAHQACRDHNQELRLLLWEAIKKAEESLDEAEDNVINFPRSGHI